MSPSSIESPGFSEASERGHRLSQRNAGGSPRSILIAAHAWYGDVIGGSFRLASEFAQSLAADGCRVTYVCCAPDSTSRAPARETIDGVDVRRYPALTTPRGGWGRMQYHIGQTTKLVRDALRDGPIDAVSGHSPLQALGAVKAAGGSGAYVNYTVHSPFDDELRENWNDGYPPSVAARLAVRAARWIDRRNLAASDRIQTDSQYTLDVLAGRHGEWIRRKGCVAPGWVDIDRFRPVADRRLARRELGTAWDTDLPVFFTLRRLESRMGVETLIEAARRLHDEGFRFRVLIGGGGSLRDRLQDLITAGNLADVVSLLGRLDEADLPRAYAACDCFVLPTRALECFGLIVLEAFAAGSPVIASRVAAIPELAARQGEEWMFAPGNSSELADRMRSYLNGDLATRINLRETACEYDREIVTRRWKELLQPDSVQQQA